MAAPPPKLVPGQPYPQHHYARLLGVCVLQLGIFTLPSPWNQLSSLGYLLMAGLMLNALDDGFTATRGRRFGHLAYRAMGLAAIVVGGFWMLTPLNVRSSGVPVVVLWAAFAVWSAARLIRQLGEERSVNQAVLRGALAGYLMLGLAGGLVCAALETARPMSFMGLREGAVLGDALQPVWRLNFVSMNYFAFVTLTTTGYGDIQPMTPLAQMVSIVLAIAGNVYLTSVLGLLIGRFSNQTREHEGH
jgi:voltage-gated potassium channel